MKRMALMAMVFTSITLHADVVLKSGDYRAVYQSRINYAVNEIFYGDTVLCNSMGYNGSILAPDPGKFIGAGHKEGGQEKLVALQLVVDGKLIAEPCGEYTGEKLEFKRVTRLDNVELTNLVRLSPAGYETEVQFRVMADQKIASFYIHQYCWSEKLTAFIAAMSDGSMRIHEFKSTNGWFLHNERSHTGWFALYNPESRTGVVCGYPAATTQAGHSRFWDRVNTHKLYFQPRYPAVLKAGYVSPVYTLRFKGFASGATDWRKTAEKDAATLVR